jgi:hypothetical protein
MRSWLGILSGIGALLLPKCPACLAVYLSYAGLGLGAAASLAPILRPLGIAILAISFAWWLRTRMKRRQPVVC